MNNQKVHKGSQKRNPLDPFTRNEWALIRSRHQFGQIPTNIVTKDGALDVLQASFPSRRQANKNKSKIVSRILKDGYRLTGFRLIDA